MLAICAFSATQHLLAVQENGGLLACRFHRRKRPSGGYRTMWKGDIGRTTWKGGIGLRMWLGGSGRMTRRGQQHATPCRAGSRAPRALCLAGLATERCASETTCWPSIVTHERLPSGLACLRATVSSLLRGARVAKLSCLHAIAHARGLLASCRRARATVTGAHLPPRRRELASALPRCGSPTRRRPSVLVALYCTREQIREREKKGKEANRSIGMSG
jgi:hypothetical protein